MLLLPGDQIPVADGVAENAGPTMKFVPVNLRASSSIRKGWIFTPANCPGAQRRWCGKRVEAARSELLVSVGEPPDAPIALGHPIWPSPIEVRELENDHDR